VGTRRGGRYEPGTGPNTIMTTQMLYTHQRAPHNDAPHETVRIAKARS
jgi:hypothetical protein